MSDAPRAIPSDCTDTPPSSTPPGDGRAQASLAAPSWILLALLALTPPAFATGFSNFELIKELLLTGGVGVAVAIWGVQALRQRAVSMMAGRVTLLGVAFALYTLGASLWATDFLAGVWGALHLVALAGVVLVVTSPVGRAIRFYDMAVAVGVGAAIAALFGVLDLAGIGLFSVLWDPPGATGAFDAMEFATAYYVVALPVLIGAAFRFPGRSRILFGGCLALAGFHCSLMIGWTGAAIFAGVCAVAVAVVAVFQRRQAGVVLTPMIVLIGGIAVLLALTHWGLGESSESGSATSLPRLLAPTTAAHSSDSPASKIREGLFLVDRTESVHDALTRDYLVEVATSLFDEKPLIGHGAGSWWSLQTEYPTIEHPFVEGMFDFYPAFRSPHSGVITVAVEYGLFGLVLFGLWLVATGAVTLSALGAGTEHAGWVVEHWALLTASLCGGVFMVFTPLLDLAPAALTWVAAMAVLTRFSAGLNDFRGWSTVWSARVGDDAGWINPVTLTAALAGVVGLGLVGPTVLNAARGYFRGQADQYMIRDLNAEAIAAYRRAGRWYPAGGDLSYDIAAAYAADGNLAEGANELKTAVKRRPYDVRGLILLGQLALGDTDRSKAVRVGRRAVQAFPNSVRAQQLLVAALDVKGKYEEAADQAEAFLDRDPPPAYRAKFHMIAGDLYFDMLQRYPDALDHYKRAEHFIQSPQRRAKLQKKMAGIKKTIRNNRRRREGKPPIDAPIQKLNKGPAGGPPPKADH